MKIWNVISGVASTLFVASILTFGVSTGIPSAAEAAAPACKGPNKNDPGCPGGGDGGTGETTCATSTTFPAFVYWDASGGTGARLTLSDAEGGCTHALTSYDNGGSITGDSALHYDDSSGEGRVIWTDCAPSARHTWRAEWEGERWSGQHLCWR